MSNQPKLPTGEGSESLPLTLADVEQYFDVTILDEATTIQQHKAMFARFVGSVAGIRDELKKFRVANLRARIYGLERMTKPELIDWRVRRMMESYDIAPRGMYELTMDVLREPTDEKWAKFYGRFVGGLTDEDLRAYRERRAEAAREREALIAFRKKAVENPETKEEFEYFCRVRGEAALDAEQLARYDELRGRAAIQRRTDDLVKKSVVERVDLGDVEMAIVKGYHTKRLCDIWIVTLSERVARELYRELEAKARQLGGRYSGKYGTNPAGFQFFDEAQAKKFLSLKDGDQSKLDRLLERRDRVRENAVEHFDTLADRMDGRAVEEIGKERKLNTPRRVGIAEKALEGARETQQMAGTLRNHASALAARMAEHLDRIRWRTHAETLDRLLRAADWKVEAAKYPWPALHESLVADLIKALDGQRGYTMTARRVRRYAREYQTTREYHASGHGMIVFNNHRICETLLELYTGARRHARSYEVERFKWALGDYRRMKLMKLESLPELRAAMREHIGRRASLPAESEALRLVKGLINSGMIRGYVPTPRDVAELMLLHADPQEGMLALEPQIGDGQLAAVFAEKHPNIPILGIEINERLSALAQRRGFEVVTKDFLSLTPEPRFDLIISNPPFHDGLDGDHIQQEYKFLTRETGRLISVVNERIFHRQDRKAADFRLWLDDVGGVDFELPEGSFLESDVPTDWDGRIVVIDHGGLRREAAA